MSLGGASPTSTRPVLTWSSGGPDLGSGFARYNVYRTAPSPAPRRPPRTTTRRAGNGSFSYTVKAVDVAGNESAASSSAAVVWDNVAPPIPTGLTGAAVVTTTPHLDWFSGGADGCPASTTTTSSAAAS